MFGSRLEAMKMVGKIYIREEEREKEKKKSKVWLGERLGCLRGFVEVVSLRENKYFQRRDSTSYIGKKTSIVAPKWYWEERWELLTVGERSRDKMLTTVMRFLLDSLCVSVSGDMTEAWVHCNSLVTFQQLLLFVSTFVSLCFFMTLFHSLLSCRYLSLLSFLKNEKKCPLEDH